MIKLAELSLQESRNAMRKLKNFTMKYKFKSESDEIDFFKNRKSHFLSRMIYYNEMYINETQKPSGGEEILKKYYRTALNHLKRFFDKNVEFYKYYRTQSTYLDDKYFTRKNLDIKLILDTFVFEADSRFSTSHDYKVAEIMANDMLEVYLKNELIKLDRTKPDTFANAPKVKLSWTDNKSALIELIYALYYNASFNNGKADIIEIAKYFEAVFNIDLGDVYRTFLELKNRNTRTKFISSLNQILQKKMQESDI
ncbi:tetracycline regulation of excision, RteC [Elizabethkingia sp. JS20170427COW]|nr:tetracycline regulation of excision, RteC [Elizabethkingia sp. JS20170427COW]